MEDRVNVIHLEPSQPGKAKKKSGWRKGVLIFVIILVVIIVFGSILIALLGNAESSDGSQRITDSGTLRMGSPYIGQLYVSGEIGAYSGGLFGADDAGYHHVWTLDRVDDMMEDPNNKAILLYVDTPGGGVYETDELYLKLKEYKEKTGRPVYTYMASEAASGGYYVSTATDKIYANRNCWTGSIGVIVGPIYDFKDLMDKYGVKSTAITSGPNKSMGSGTEHMTKEQKEILQSMVDEAYDQFVSCVAEGRDMEESKVRKLADGRLYTATQAKENGLIDEMGSQEDAVADLRNTYHLTGVKVTPVLYDSDLSMMDKLFYSLSTIGQSKADSDLAALQAMMEKNQKATISYMAPIRK